MNTKLYTITEAAKMLGISRQAVHYLVKHKLIRIANINVSKIFIDTNAINEYLANKK